MTPEEIQTLKRHLRGIEKVVEKKIASNYGKTISYDELPKGRFGVYDHNGKLLGLIVKG